MALVNLGNDKLNINTTTAKGLEKVIGIVGKFIIDAQLKTDSILYGTKLTNAKAKGIEKITQKGVLKTLKEIADVDFCNLLNYAATQTGQGGANKFNPEGPAENATPFEKRIWSIQNYAFKVLSKIDKYYSQYGSATGQDSRLGLLELITSVNLEMKSLLSPTEGLNDPEILKQFPEMSTATNYLSNALDKFNSYTNVRNIPVEEFQKVINFIDRIRIISTSIVALNNPAALLNSANIITGGKTQEAFNIINQYVTPGPKVIVLIKEIIKRVQNINTVAKKVLGYINLARTIIKLGLLLIKVFTIIRKFLFGIPIPAAFVPVGATTVAADSSESVKEQGIDKPIKRLQQINLVLNLIAILVTSIVAALDSIIRSLTSILFNIQSCNQELGNEIQNTINDLNDTRGQLQKFLDDYNSSKNAIDKTFGGYTIEIVTEQVVDEGINLRRRYGIARGSDNTIAVQSTPTFASLDLIIVNEVKVLLVSKGLVNIGPGGLSSQDSQVIVEALNYLKDQDITLSDIDINPNQAGDIIEESSNSELTTFMDNLPGGKALRKKVRKRLAEQKQKLGEDLQSTDPNSKYSSNIIQN